MNFLKKIGAWFRSLLSAHNVKAVAVTAERGAQTAADIAAGTIPGAISEAEQTADAAKSIHVDTK